MCERTPTTVAVNVVHAGAFGRSVTREIQKWCTDVTECCISSVDDKSLFVEGRIHIVVTPRREFHFPLRLQEYCFRTVTPFIPAALEGTRLVIGPVVVPGRGPCWSCYAARIRQHCGSEEINRELHKYYFEHPEAAPIGYLPSHSSLAANKLLEYIDRLDRDPDIPGSLWECDLVKFRMAESRVVGVDFCARCGPSRPSGANNCVELRRALSYLWDAPNLASE